MELLNATKMQAGYTMGMRPDGRELLVVVVKGTFVIPKLGEEPKLAPEQAPLVVADTFTGEPGFSAPVYESEYAPVKPRCDVLLLGSAYAPVGRPAERVTVSIRVGRMQKSFDVVGNRVWRSGLKEVSSTRPEPFTVMPISYDTAFGGVDNTDPDRQKHGAYALNTVGKGFFIQDNSDRIEGKPLPNTEEFDKMVTSPRGTYRPMALGPVGRAWQPRSTYAGTYDQNWLDNVFPFLPADFDERYYQAAPPDQQVDYLSGGEEVALINLTPEGVCAFSVPKLEVPVTFFFHDYEQREMNAFADTLVIEPNLDRFFMLWRASLRLQRNIFEVVQVVVGRLAGGWYRARELGKTYYPSLKALTDERRGQREGINEEPDLEEGGIK
jgi:hypothetical protein